MWKIGLSIVAASLTLVCFAPAVEAMPMEMADMYREQHGLDPFELTFSAYQGRLSDQGIPGYGTFVSRIDSGSIDAEDVIQAAVDAGDLAASALEDASYARFLGDMLYDLANSTR